jgi:NADH-quinone oxidoreductase subunit L
MIENLSSWILFLPLIAAGLITLFTRRNPAVSAYISIAAIAASFLLTLALFFRLGDQNSLNVTPIQWLSVGNLKVEIGFLVDRLSVLMLLVVTGVGLMIHVYSYGYMHGDKAFSRFFASLSLFTFSMIGIVFATNFFQMFIFWELVGLSSYLLIGYWFEKPSAADACKKAFLTNRIGDFGFLLGIIILWTLLGSVQFADLQSAISQNPAALGALATVAGLLIFMGAMGKSAQFPLHVWLPDAMEGPTPVSALIHAATMVTAGVYLVARCAPLFVLSQTALGFVAIIGAITALLAAFTALTQYDLKRVLAYSTVSQLGFMFMSLGAAAADPVHLMQPAVTFAMFHMFTHAFFKAVLFLSAGSVMHSMGDVIDMRRFSGLKKVMPVTHWTFLAGAAALSGLPLLSGFWSKDEILAVIADADRVPGYGLFFGSILAVALLASLLTAFYTFRAYFLTFHGPERFPEEAGHHPHEAPPAMAWPLRILGVAALLVGAVAGPTHLYAHYLHHTPSLPLSEPHGLNYVMMVVSSIIAIAGVGFAWMVYGKADRKAYNVQERYSPAYELSLQGLYLDAVYQALVVRPMRALSELSETLDRLFVDKLVDAVGYLPGIFGSLVRPIQNGFLQSYALVMLLGLVIFVFGVLRAIAGM